MRRRNICTFGKLGGLLVALLLWSGVAGPQNLEAATLPNWSHVTAPFNVDVALLLTDGNILMDEYDTSSWWLLKPDNNGNYGSGTFVRTGSFPVALKYAPLYFASAVLPDGRVIVEGGEYNIDFSNAVWTSKGAIYEPTTETWTQVDPPKTVDGWTLNQIGDAQSVVRADGAFMLADINGGDFATLDPATLSWSVFAGTGKADVNDEEGWTLLPGGDVLTVDAEVFNASSSLKNSEILDHTTNKWSSAGNTVKQLWDSRKDCGGTGFTNEVGADVLRPDGTVFAAGSDTCPGAAGHTAIYNVTTKKWKKGPDFPSGNDIADGPAAVLPDGNVLVDTNPGWGNSPSTLYEFNGTKFLTIPQPAGLNPSNTEGGRMLVTPNGSVMLLHGDTTDLWFYHPKGTYQSSWRPKITTKFASCLNDTGTYTVKGTQFNGLTQGAYFGDDAQSATNYPLVRFKITGTGHVFFARTHDFSSGVATGSKVVSTKFDIPMGTEVGAGTIEVIANGIPSKSVKVTVESPCL
jgi:hypothetical protein